MIRKIYYGLHEAGKNRAPFFYNIIFKYRKIVKYFISGCTAATVDISLLFVFADIVGLNVHLAVVLAFLGALGVSFTLQKFWAFRDMSTENIHKQAVQFAIVATSSAILNSALMYVAVDFFDIYYIVAQFIVGIVIAVVNFLAYSVFVFKKPKSF